MTKFDLVDAWVRDACPPASDHARLEIAHAVHAERGEGAPLAPRDPVPGCDCPACTGVSEDHPARSRLPRLHRNDALPVEEARRVPILQVVERLGLGEPAGRWGEPRLRCPFHDDQDPSLRLNVEQGLWFCDPCGVGGDGIELVRRVRDVSFADAVREMV